MNSQGRCGWAAGTAKVGRSRKEAGLVCKPWSVWGGLGGVARAASCEQVLEDGPPVGRGRKLGHVGDAGGQGRGRRRGAQASPRGAPWPRVPPRRCRRRGRPCGQPRSASATRSSPCVPRAAQVGRPRCARTSQSKRPSVMMAHGGAAPSRPSPRTGLGPGRAWNRGDRCGSMARPASQRTRPPAISGTDHHPGEAFASAGEKPRVLAAAPG